VTEKGKYATGAALRAALEERLKQIAKVENVELQRLRRQVAFDRFLARLFYRDDQQWVLKGGYAMELRFQIARATKDLDFTVRASSAPVEEALLEHLQEAGHYFHKRMRIPLSFLPGRIYKGLRSNTRTARYFVDRFPVLLGDSESPSPSLPPVSFTYCDLEERDLIGFMNHLRNYERFLRQLPAFEFIYACSNSEKFARARRFFHRLFDLDDTANIENTVRYFEVRRLWDEKKYNAVDRAGRDLLRWAKQHPRQEFLDAAYRKWLSGNLSATEIAGILRPVQGMPRMVFSTHTLPRSHNVFSCSSGVGSGTGKFRQRSAPVPLPFRTDPAKRLMEGQ